MGCWEMVIKIILLYGIGQCSLLTRSDLNAGDSAWYICYRQCVKLGIL